jgi:hypothetical protein
MARAPSLTPTRWRSFFALEGQWLPFHRSGHQEMVIAQFKRPRRPELQVCRETQALEDYDPGADLTGALDSRHWRIPRGAGQPVTWLGSRRLAFQRRLAAERTAWEVPPLLPRRRPAQPELAGKASTQGAARLGRTLFELARPVPTAATAIALKSRTYLAQRADRSVSPWFMPSSAV